MHPPYGDFGYQLDFVINAAWRLLSLQDANLLSPSSGCFHYAYWRDKTSEFPDARFQEAGATLALLSLPTFDAARDAKGLPSSQLLYQRFQLALRQWDRQQNPDGSFDEWYKGERGFAATEFTIISFCLAGRFLGDRLLSADRALMRDIVSKAATWLASRDDRVKANHESAAAAALALAWELVGNPEFKQNAKQKISDTLSRQHSEGWFPEVGGMDLGYCSVLLDYVMIYTFVTGDQVALPAMKHLFDFMSPLIHPDGTISAEMGLCLNPYVSRLGLGLLSKYYAPAAALIARFKAKPVGVEALRPYVADDLRLCRWSHLPVAAALLIDEFDSGPADEAAFTRSLPTGWTWMQAAGVCAYHSGDIHIYFSPAGGGVIRAFVGEKLVIEDLVPFLKTAQGSYCIAGYDPRRPTIRSDNGFQIKCRYGKVRFFFPGFLSRLILRVGCTTAVGARLLRAAIDYVRIVRRSASNQSAAPIANTDSPYCLERNLEIQGSTFTIADSISSEGPPIALLDVSVNATIQGANTAFDRPSGAMRNFVLTKSLDLGPARQVEIKWELQPGE